MNGGGQTVNPNPNRLPEELVVIETVIDDGYIPSEVSVVTPEGENESSTIIDYILGYSNEMWYSCLVFLLLGGIILGWVSFQDKFQSDRIFWASQISKYAVITLIQYMCSLLVKHYKIKVNYTRKVVHISYFIWPQILDYLIVNYTSNIYSELWNVYMILLLLFMASEPFRNRFKIVKFLYLSVDRPEDQPYTLVWFSSQIIVTMVVFIPFVVYFKHLGHDNLVFIPILVNGLGDGLAEPIGIRYGKHKYKTRSCLSDREYTRSYEGSLCVFLVSLTTVAFYRQAFTTGQYIFCLTTIPVLSTIVEAVAPHTWDSPLIYSTVLGLLTFSIKYIK
jgi:phytol kinase